MIRAFFLCAALLGMAAGGCAPDNGEAGEPLPRAAKIEPVAAAGTASRREFVGRVEARLTVDLAFQVGGRLADFPVSEGETVPEGALIARLETQDFDRALRQARVQLQQAEQTLERTRTLHERGIAADAALEEAVTAYDLQRVALDTARQNLTYATMTAPFEGLVSRRLVDNFSTVAAGQPIARLQDISELRVAISVPESLIATLDRERAYDVVARFPFLPDQSFRLEYRELIAEPDQASQTYRVIFALPDDIPANILPGMTATVSVLLDEEIAPETEAVRIPVSALSATPEGGWQVWIYDPATQEVRAQDVVTGPVSGALVRIERGLKAGEFIVTAGVNALHEGMKVRPMATRANMAAGGR